MQLVSNHGELLTRHEGTDNETPIDHGVGEQDEPAVAGAFLELASGFGTGDTAGRVLAADTDADKEAPGNEHVEHANGIAMPVGTGS